METLKLISFLVAFLISVASKGANLNLFVIDRGTTADAAFVTENKSLHDDQILGSYQNTEQVTNTDSGVVAPVYADQNSNVSLSNNVLSVCANANCDAAFGITGAGILGQVFAQSVIQINFTVDSPFNFSVQTSATQSIISNDVTMDGVQTFVALAQGPADTNLTFLFGQQVGGYGTGPSSGTNCGILQPGSYVFFANSTFDSIGSSAFPGPYSASSHYHVVFSVSPASPPIYISAIGEEQAQITWSTNYTGFILEAASTLPAASWQTVTNSVLVAGQQYSVVVDTLEIARFFRLRNN